MLADQSCKSAVTLAEALARRLSDSGVTTYMLVRDDRRALLAFDPPILSLAPEASDLAELICLRFSSERQFAIDLVAYLFDVGNEDHVYTTRSGRDLFPITYPDTLSGPLASNG